MVRSGRHLAVWLAVIAALGVALRAAYLLTIGRDVAGIGDWFFYHWQGHAIADGLGFVDPLWMNFTGRRLASALHPPLYPLLLGGLSELGARSALAHRMLGLPLGAATIVLVGLLGRRAGGPRVALVAAGLCAVYPVMIATDGALMSETLYGPLVAGTLLGAWSLLERPRVWVAAVTGVVLGLAALTRAEALLLLPLLVWPVAVRGGAGWPARAAVATAACVLVIAPWTVRNLAVFDRFVGISTNDSTVVAGANCPLTYGGENLGLWDIRCISDRRFDDESVQAEAWRSEGLEYARDHAGRLPVVVAIRVLRMWDLWQPRRMVVLAEGRHLRVTQAGVAAWFLLLPFAVAGAVALRRAGRPWLLLLAPAAMVCVSAVLGYGMPRLRHAAEPSVLVLAAVGLVWLATARPWART
jgi:4-amino-4-deoxy-L-arabinose transferase-like glycosyltransferase